MTSTLPGNNARLETTYPSPKNLLPQDLEGKCAKHKSLAQRRKVVVSEQSGASLSDWGIDYSSAVSFVDGQDNEGIMRSHLGHLGMVI